MLREGKGSIGDKAIGVIALLVMIWWEGKFKEKLVEVNIINEVLKIYIDDVNGVYKAVQAGTEYVEGKLIHNREKENSEKDVPEDERTMLVIRDIANSVEPMIKMTIDVPSKYEDQKVPMLDTKVWLNEDRNILHFI